MYSSGRNVETIILNIGKNLSFCELLSFKKHFDTTPLNIQKSNLNYDGKRCFIHFY